MSVRREGVTCKHCLRSWAPQLKELSWHWGHGTPGRLAQRLNRSVPALMAKAKRLGFEMGCPSGWVRVTQLADEEGWDRDTLMRILRHQNIHLRASWSAPRPKRGRGRPKLGARRRGVRFYVVDRERARRAIRDWLTLETPTEAAARTGLSHTFVRNKLVAAGHVPPARGRRWRLPRKIYDVVLAGLRPRARQPASAHARTQPRPPAKHGGRTKYAGGCRCDECRAWNAARARRHRANRAQRAEVT